MDFNSLLRIHLHGEAQNLIVGPHGEQYPSAENTPSPDAAPIHASNIQPISNSREAATTEMPLFHLGNQPSTSDPANPQKLMNDAHFAAMMSPAPTGHHFGHNRATSLPGPVPAYPESHMTNEQKYLYNLQRILLNSDWLRANEAEPPVQPNDELVRIGLVEPWRSRFDAFIASESFNHTCKFILPETLMHCPYANVRRDRLRAHLLAHFSYTPYMCQGVCGKENCTLGFADNGLLVEHVRRTLRPRTKCEFCEMEISPQNYRRHLATKHSNTTAQ